MDDNKRRAVQARSALVSHLGGRSPVAEEDAEFEDQIGDLITDLLHLARRAGHDVGRLLRCARRNYQEERVRGKRSRSTARGGPEATP